MRKIKLFGALPFVLTIVFFLQATLFANNAFAQNIIAKPSPATLVTDVAGVLTPEQKQALENKLVAIDDSSSNQIAVVIIPSLDGYPKEEYA
ncbi:MAG: TPM domain-containing protein, partial [Crocinitomicaceae bacterium]|nr:TPM domain-containing protein [Crocinitomicaceae bacterium]